MKKHATVVSVVFGFSLCLFVAAAQAGVLVPLPKAPPVPADNPITPAKVQLGKMLYFEPRISRTGTVSCNSCHNVMGSGTDNRPFSFGVEGHHGTRAAPTVWNSAFLSVQFWDGRAKSLEEQALGPMVNPVEMGMPNHDAVVLRLMSIPGYRDYFKKAFPTEMKKDGGKITIDDVAKAIATYERTLLTPDSPVDRFLRGDKKALSPAAQRGYKLIQTVGCIACHNGPDFAGPQLPEGVGFYQKFPVYPDSTYVAKYHLMDDLGRYETTHQDSDKHMWRVPTWRNIALTAPYFHNGSVKTLDEAVHVMAKLQLDKTLTDDQVRDIVEFLKGLTGKFPHQTMPTLPQTPGQVVFE